MVIFSLRFIPSLPYALAIYLLGPLGAWALKMLHIGVTFLGVARGNRIMSPRLLIWLDLLLSFTLGGIFGIACVVPRFILSLAHLFSRLVVFSQPILPSRLSSLDPCVGVYGGAMKGNFIHSFSGMADQR